MDVQNGTEGVVVTIDALDFITSQDLIQTDVTEFVYMVKGCAEDLDEDAVLNKTLLDGIAHTTDAKYEVTLSATDYSDTALQTGYTYRVFVGIKTSSSTSFLEAVMEDATLTITQDGIRG